MSEDKVLRRSIDEHYESDERFLIMKYREAKHLGNSDIEIKVRDRKAVFLDVSEKIDMSKMF